MPHTRDVLGRVALPDHTAELLKLIPSGQAPAYDALDNSHQNHRHQNPGQPAVATARLLPSAGWCAHSA